MNASLMTVVRRRLAWERRRRKQARFTRDLLRRGVIEDESVRVVHTANINPETPISIGRGTTIHQRCALKGQAPIFVGRYCEFAEGTHVVSSNHAVHRASTHATQQYNVGLEDVWDTRGPVRIGHNVWLGDNAMVLAGVQIGNGAIVGAGAVVTRDVEPFTIVGGVPAVPIRKRFSDAVIRELEKAAWWDWTDDEMRERREFFEADLQNEGAASLLRRLS